MNDYSKYTKDQLLALNEEICAEIRARNAVEKATAIRKFSVGDKVFFVHKGFKTLCTVTKVLRTNIDVVTDAGRPWRVPANIVQFQS